MRLTLVPLSHMLCNPQMLRQFYIVEIRARSILCLRNLHSQNLLSSFVFCHLLCFWSPWCRKGLNTVQLHYCFLQMTYCTYFVFIGLWPPAITWFKNKWEVDGIRVNISKSEAMAFCRTQVDCALWVGIELFLQVKQLTYLCSHSQMMVRWTEQ